MSKLIPLTQGKFAIVDNEDFERLNQYKWGAKKVKNTWYATRYTHKSEHAKVSFVYMHREILQTPSKMDSHHCDRNGLNNKKINLRIATRGQNIANRIKQKNTSSRFKGVYWNRPANKWLAAIRVNKCRIHLGFFTSEIEAAKVYDKKANECFGEFARPNFKRQRFSV